MTQDAARSHTYSKQISFKQFNVLSEDEQIVEGYVTDDKIDVDGHVIDQAGFREAVTEYLGWGNIREQHMLPVGMLVEAPEWNKFIVRIVDDNVWKKIKAGLYKGFSIGIRVLDYEIEPLDRYTDSDFDGLPEILVRAIKEAGMIIRITKMVLAEVSVVDRPANPRALVTAFKAASIDDTDSLPVLKNVEKAQESLKGANQMAEQKNENVEKDIVQDEQEVEAQVVDETVEVEAEVDVTEIETVEKEIAEDTGEDHVAESSTEDEDFSDKFANLEKSVNELNARVDAVTEQVSVFVDEIEKHITSAVTTAIESFNTVDETKAEDTLNASNDESALEVAAEDEKAISAEQPDVAEILDKAFEGLEDRIAKAVAAALAERDEKQAKAEKSSERDADVNMGDVDEDIEAATKSMNSGNDRPTYRDVAGALLANLRVPSA